MTYKGIIKNGTVVLDRAVEMPEGATVRVHLEPPDRPATKGSNTAKLGVWQALQNLPDDARIEDFLERVYLLYKVERGVHQLDSGQGIPHEEARKRFSEWLE